MWTDNPVLDAEAHERAGKSNHVCCSVCGNVIEEMECVILDRDFAAESAICDDCIRAMLKPIRKAAEADEAIAKSYSDIKEILFGLKDQTPTED